MHFFILLILFLLICHLCCGLKWWADFPPAGEMRDYPSPELQSAMSENQLQAKTLSEKLKSLPRPQNPMRVAVIGAGLAGLSCAKYLTDAGFIPTVYEASNVLGGLATAWKDSDGDWYEAGIHIFFGACELK